MYLAAAVYFTKETILFFAWNAHFLFKPLLCAFTDFYFHLVADRMISLPPLHSLSYLSYHKEASFYNTLLRVIESGDA